MPRTSISRSLLVFIVALFLSHRTADAIIVDGTLVDKNTFLAYLINQGGGGNINSFAYLNNGGAAGPSTLIADPTKAVNNFGARMAVAAQTNPDNSPTFPLIVHVGQNVPRVFFGAFQYDPAAPAGNTAGHQTIDLQAQSRSRIAWIDRLGEGMLPTRDTVIQEGDLLHLVIREENAGHAYTVIERGPEDS